MACQWTLHWALNRVVDILALKMLVNNEPVSDDWIPEDVQDPLSLNQCNDLVPE